MTAKKAEPFIVLADTREQAIPPFPENVVVQRKMLKEGDYSTPALEHIARIERKSVTDLASTLSWGRERFERELERLKSLRFKCICVEGDVTSVYRVTQMHPHAILGSLSAMLARWECPVLFCGNEAGCGRVMVGVLYRWQRRVEEEQLAAADALEKALTDSMPGVVVPTAKEAADVDATAGKVLGP